jgi:hypothetical protein
MLLMLSITIFQFLYEHSHGYHSFRGPRGSLHQDDNEELDWFWQLEGAELGEASTAFK